MLNSKPEKNETQHIFSVEFKKLITLSFPIIVAQLAQASMGFVDTVMAGSVNATELAGVALGTSIWIPLYLLLTGILLAVTSKVSERNGARDPKSISHITQQSIWLSIILIYI